MTHLCQDDGCTYLDRNEEWHVTGYVTVKVYVDFTTTSEPGDQGFDDDLGDAVDDVVSGDYEIVDSDELDLEAQEVEWE